MIPRPDAPARPAHAAPGLPAALAPLLLLGSLLGCAPRGPVRWAGYVLEDPAATEAPGVVPGAALFARALDGAPLAEAVADADGYVELVLPAERAIALRVEAPAGLPTVQFTDTPEGSAAWLTGAVFARDAAAFAALAERALPEAEGPSEAGSAALWIEPLVEGPWAAEAIALRDEAGEPVGQRADFWLSAAGTLVPDIDEDRIADIILFLELPDGALSLDLAGRDGAARAVPLRLAPGELGLIPRLTAPE